MQRATRGTMRTPHPLPAPAPRRGVTLIGLLAWAIIVGFVGYLLVRVVPTVTEFYTIQGVVDRIAASPASTVAEIRGAFDMAERFFALPDSVKARYPLSRNAGWESRSQVRTRIVFNCSAARVSRSRENSSWRSSTSRCAWASGRAP